MATVECTSGREALTVVADFKLTIVYYRAGGLGLLGVPCWEFDACLEMLRAEFGRTDLVDDLDWDAISIR